MQAKHFDEYRLTYLQLRKEMLRKCEEADILASLPDREEVIDSILPYIMQVIK
jgi:hypothetical protein